MRLYFSSGPGLYLVYSAKEACFISETNRKQNYEIKSYGIYEVSIGNRE